jgi:hypothetical protein
MADKVVFWLDGIILNVQLQEQYNHEDSAALFENTFDDPAIPQKIAILLDGRLLTTQESEQKVERTLYALTARARRILCMAYVAPSDLQFGIGRQFSVDAESYGIKFEPFRELQSAKAWIAKIIQ